MNNLIKSTNCNEFSLDIEKISYVEAIRKSIGINRDKKGLIQEIADSKLRGCGGAGFPTGLKIKMVAEEKADQKYIVCNADEGEPGTFKDREIFTRFAEYVFTGMTISGYVIDATKGFLYIRGEYEYMKNHLENVLEKLRKANLLGDRILGTETSFDISIRFGAGAYVCGEETSLLESMEGNRGEPRNKPPFPASYGFLGKPTMLSNVETFAYISGVAQNGKNFYVTKGTEKSKGHKLFSISGDCKKPGVYQFNMGTKVSEILEYVGGLDSKATQFGGASGRLIPHWQYDSRVISFEDVCPGGSIIVIGKDRNILCAAKNFMEFFVEESCGQCTPCRDGNVRLLDGIEKLIERKCSNEYLDILIELCEAMKISSKCGLGQASPNIFLDMVEHFRNEILGFGDGSVGSTVCKCTCK